MILNPDGSFQLPCRRSFPTPWVAFTKISGLSALFPRSRVFGKYNLTYLDPETSYEVDAVSGSFMMITREAYEKVGGLDESFFMYGEDLDWCYRVKKAGFAVSYVHETRIVHYKGESTRRSDIDELRLFYEAMELFVRKHFTRSRVLTLVLRIGITVRGAMAFAVRSATPVLLAAADGVLVDLALFLSAWLYFGDIWFFLHRAHPVVWFVPAFLVVGTGFFAGLYSWSRYSVARAAVTVVIGYILISTVVYFFKEYAYSRAVVLLSGFLSIILLPGWRLAIRAVSSPPGPEGRRGGLFGRRTVIVGTGPSAQEVMRKIRARVDGGYDVVGFIALSAGMVGEKIAGLEVVGSTDNVGKVINEQRVTEVIFSTDGISYGDILGVISRGGSRSVNYRLVPGSLEAIVGKTRIDELDTLPLVDIDYNIHRPGNRLTKRLFDLLLGIPLCVLLYLPVRLFTPPGGGKGVRRAILRLPRVIAGRYSLVGRPIEQQQPGSGREAPRLELGPPGLTGLVQVNRRADLSPEDVERYLLFYAQNQSIALDLEILAKALLLSVRKEGK
jgi:hypothetical protein